MTKQSAATMSLSSRLILSVLFVCGLNLASAESGFTNVSSKKKKTVWHLTSSSAIESYIGAGKDLIAAEQYNQALEVIDKAMDIEPNLGSLFHLKGLVYMKMGKRLPAIKEFKRAAQLDRKDVESIIALGQLQSTKLSAVGHYTTALKMDPGNVKALKLRAETQLEMGYPDTAIEDYSKAIDFNPDSSELLLRRGEIYLSQEKIEKARSDFERALEINKNNAQALLKLSRLSVVKGLRKGLKELESAKRIFASSVDEEAERDLKQTDIQIKRLEKLILQFIR